jgi:hypothetical protein
MEPNNKPIAVSSPYFNLLLWLVAVICFLSLGVIAALAFLAPDPLSKAQERAMELGTYAFTTTLGAIVGLFGGRAGHVDHFGQLPAQPGSSPPRRQPSPRTLPPAGQATP